MFKSLVGIVRATGFYIHRLGSQAEEKMASCLSSMRCDRLTSAHYDY